MSHTIKQFCDKIDSIYDSTLPFNDGDVASYIPQLKRVNPNQYGISICTIDGQRYNIGDSNIDFFVYIQAIDRLSTFTLKSELIKKIHERFDRENIDINYPVRKIITDPVNNSNDFLR